MLKKIKSAVCYGATLVAGFLFTLIAAPVIHLSGLDNVDSCPTPEDVEKANRFAEELKRERSK